ncbi:MAG: hypothetical protein INH41_21130 [Myxococcaceae bacterium]|jgi:hypothetical protein|nr:hypothetical protein [Myxococcaceae bacterium]MCA3014897.1 hypothetical protein [Myxococcaceae bacterium]
MVTRRRKSFPHPGFCFLVAPALGLMAFDLGEQFRWSDEHQQARIVHLLDHGLAGRPLDLLAGRVENDVRVNDRESRLRKVGKEAERLAEHSAVLEEVSAEERLSDHAQKLSGGADILTRLGAGG